MSVAQRDSIPAYVVFTDATLTAIAETEPADAAALGRISGVGPRKLDRYGAAVLALVAGAAVADAIGGDGIGFSEGDTAAGEADDTAGQK